jgi:nucleotide-binding universal stress UspA family protein
MFKKILAPVRGTREDAAALDVGFLLARRFGARVEAFYAAPSSTPSVTAETKPSDEVARLEGTELYRTARALFAERLERITSIVPQSSGLSARFSALPGPEADLIAAIGRVSDLIIIAHPAEDGSPWPNLSLESAIRETGCPVLLVPRAVSRIGARVAIAWNGTLKWLGRFGSRCRSFGRLSRPSSSQWESSPTNPRVLLSLWNTYVVMESKGRA